MAQEAKLRWNSMNTSLEHFLISNGLSSAFPVNSQLTQGTWYSIYTQNNFIYLSISNTRSTYVVGHYWAESEPYLGKLIILKKILSSTTFV